MTLDDLTLHYHNGDLDDLGDEALRAGVSLCDDLRQRLYNRHGDARLDDVSAQLEHLTNLSHALNALIRQRVQSQARREALALP
jgi:hypothetical protein